jgi:hypothetical protein
MNNAINLTLGLGHRAHHFSAKALHHLNDTPDVMADEDETNPHKATTPALPSPSLLSKGVRPALPMGCYLVSYRNKLSS